MEQAINKQSTSHAVNIADQIKHSGEDYEGRRTFDVG